MPLTSLPAPETAAAVACRHCGLDVPAEDLARGREFCCTGCESVFELIQGAGLSRFYDLKRGKLAPPANRPSPSLAWLDAALDAAGPDDPARLELSLQGLHCAACLWLVQELFRRHEAGVSLVINPALGTARVTWDRSRGDLGEFVREAESFGYRFGPADEKRTAKNSNAKPKTAAAEMATPLRWNIRAAGCGQA